MIKLGWGETPFDNLTKDELLRLTQKMYSAIESAHSCLAIIKISSDNGLFWGRDGTGGNALEKCEQVIRPIEKEFDSESIYRSFYRYANDLLFDRKNFGIIGSGWVVCPKCLQMVGETRKPNGERTSNEGKNCSEVMDWTKCDGILEKLDWKFFKK
jgi:hypothetical protein